MGLDTQFQLPDDGEPDAAPVREPARKATTASMQSLLAHYFETQHFDTHGLEISDPDSDHFEAARVHALSQPHILTRPATEPHVDMPHLASEAAFVPLPVVEEAPDVVASVAVEDALAEPDWPQTARHLIDALKSENEALRRQVQDQALALHNAQSLADNDVLTPTLNRRAFLREVQRAMADCRRYGEEACLVYLDMDGFKGINDSYGHGAGDAALIFVAETLTASVREGDNVGRMGGDEFAILLRRADLKSSRIKAMKLEAELALGTFDYNGLYLKVGGSFGVRAYAGQTTAEAWLSEADAAMFLVKKAVR